MITMNQYPVNQVFLGESYLPNPNMDIESQLQAIKLYEEKLKGIKTRTTIQSKEDSIWDNIDKEILPLNPEQRNILFNNKDYSDISNQLQNLVQIELLNLVKNKISSSEEGNKLLDSQLEIIKKLKTTIIEESNREMELFKKFREFSKSHPNVTYEEFIKTK